jgi:hypothetical protein
MEIFGGTLTIKFRLSHLNITTPKGGGFNDYNKIYREIF